LAAPFHASVRIRFEHADPEGIMFFGNIYGIAHEVYEQFVEHLGFTYKDWFLNKTWGVPLRKSECLYSAPLLPGQTYDVKVTVPQISDSSFGTHYIFALNGKTHAEVTLAHVFVDRNARSKTAIPSEIRGRLETYQREHGLTK